MKLNSFKTIPLSTGSNVCVSCLSQERRILKILVRPATQCVKTVELIADHRSRRLSSHLDVGFCFCDAAMSIEETDHL